LLLFVGDDWAEAHHDVELMDAAGRTVAKARLPEGVAGRELGPEEGIAVHVGVLKGNEST